MNLQGSPEWLAERLGKVTASRISDVVAKTKTGYGASRANYMAELLAERLTGTPAERFVTAPMQWGLDHEEEARNAYEYFSDFMTAPAGFVLHPGIVMSGASPDGYVGANGLIEIKCPNTATHIATLLGAPIEARYVDQVQWQMACTGREWVDWCSFDPRLPAGLRLFVHQVTRDEARIEYLEAEVRNFLTELRAMETGLRSRLEAT